MRPNSVERLASSAHRSRPSLSNLRRDLSAAACSIDEMPRRLPNFFRDLRLRRNKLRREPRKQTDQIVRHQNLSVAMFARSQFRSSESSIASVICRAASAATISSTTENAPAFSTASASFINRSALRGRASFHFVAAFLAHALRQHSDVRHQRNSRAARSLDLRDMACAAFEFYRLRAGIHQTARAFATACSGVS